MNLGVNIVRGIAVLSVVCVVGVVAFAPVETSASAITFDPIDYAVQDIAQFIKEYMLDAIAFMMVDRLVEAVAQDAVSWIQGGFEGKPGFVENTRDFLGNVAEREVDEFIEGAHLDFLCDPFEAQIRVELRESRRIGPRFECTLDRVVANYDRFVGGTFDDGGWPGWIELMSVPKNNPYGAFMLAQQEMEYRQRLSVDEEKGELTFGRGFLRVKSCEDIVGPPEPVDPNFVGPPPPAVRCTTQTPGAFVDQAIQKQSHVGIDRLTVGDEIDEIIGALMAQLAGQLLSQAGGLSGR